MRMEPARIMCAVDFSDFTHMIVSYGKSLASEFDAKLYLCHIVPTLMVSSHMSSYIDYAGIESDHIHNARNRLEEIAKEFDIQCDIIVSVSLGHPADQIESAARQNKIDMVIAATNGGSGVIRFLTGSVTNKLIKILSCPLLVLHAKDDGRVSQSEEKIKLNRILVGCDFSPDSRLAFDYALSLAQEFQTRLYLAHVVSPMEPVELMVPDPVLLDVNPFSGWTGSGARTPDKSMDEVGNRRSTWLKQIETRLLEMVPGDSRNWCTPVIVVLEGRPYQELITYAGKIDADMIVLGIRGHSLLEKFLVGSTTDRVISRASCPVLAVRPIS